MAEAVAYTRSQVSKISNATDRRSRIDLGLFVLALVKRRLATPYDLRTSAAISPGASIPVLRRLESAGYVRKGQGGPRNRQEYVITSKGTTFLDNSCQQLFQAPPTADLEAVLRTASLALLMGEPKRSVGDYLARAADVWKAADTAAKEQSRTPENAVEVFPWMREAALARRKTREATILRQLASKVRKLNLK